MAINLVMFTATGELGEAETLMVALKAGAEEMRNYQKAARFWRPDVRGERYEQPVRASLECHAQGRPNV